MAWNEILSAVFGSAVIASVITSMFAKAQSDKHAKIENIIKERKAWRDKLRDIVTEVETYAQQQDSEGIAFAEARLVVLLNPLDKMDLAIITALNSIPEAWSKECRHEFMDRVAYLLKHDWERVKLESTTRISPQTLALASLFVLLVTVTSELTLLGWGAAHNLKVSALWLSMMFLSVAVVANRPKGKISFRKLFYWVTNESIREDYRRRDAR